MSRDRLRELHAESSAATLYAVDVTDPVPGRKGGLLAVGAGDEGIRLDVLDARVDGDEGQVTAFLQLAEEVQDLVSRIQRRTRDIAQEHQRALLSISHEEEREIWEGIAARMDENAADLSHGRALLRALVVQGQPLAEQGHAQMCQLQQSHLTQRLLDAASEYQQVQKDNKRSYEQRLLRQLAIARPAASPDEVAAALNAHHAGHPVFAQDLLQHQPSPLRRQSLAEVEARHAELRRLEASIDAVTELHGEFELFLARQQERIEEIIVNAIGTDECLRAGNREITRAIVYRQRSRRRWVWVTGGVVVLAGLVALLTYLSLTGRFGGSAMVKG